MTFAFHRFSSLSGGMDKASTRDLEALRASARQAAENIERAKRYNYNHPILTESLSMALLYQFRYQDAVSKLNEYFAEVKGLQSRLSSLERKCDSGFNHLNAEGYWYLGYIYDIEGNFEPDKQRKTDLYNKARDQFDEAVKLKEDYFQAYGMIGLLDDLQGRNEEAISHYKKALLYGTNESLRASNYDSLGLIYSKLGRPAEAIENIREALKLAPDNPRYYDSLASVYVGQGKLEETFAMLKKAADLRKDAAVNPSQYYYLGVAYAIRFMQKKNEEDFNGALKALRKAVEIKPDEARIYQALGVAYHAHSNADEAIANYNKSIEYDPKNVENYVYLSETYSGLKHNDDAAIKSLKQAIEVQPDYVRAYWRLAQAYHRKSNDTEAIKQLLKAVEVNPKYLEASLDLAYLYRTQKNYTEAVKYLQRAIELAPTDFEPYKELAKVYEDQHQNEEAARYYEEAMSRLKADDAFARTLYMGRIARLQGRYTEAITYFQKINPADSPDQANYDIGLTYVASNNKTAAMEQYQHLVQLKSTLAEDLLRKIKEMK